MQLQRLVSFVLLLCLCMATSAWSALTLQGDNGNPHNLSSSNTTAPVHATTETRVCVFCHTPHGASANSVLWNRGAPVTATFPLYGNGGASIAILQDAASIASSGYGVNYPNGATRMCMSCHDGATAIGNVLVGPAIATNFTTLADQGGADPLLDNAIVDLSVAHPVSFNYSASVADIEAWNGVGTYGFDLVSAGITPLENGTHMQCTTCHDPHLSTRGDASYGSLPFWRHQGNANSYDDVCQNCHASTPISGAMQ